jgi:Glycosyl hydrolases family 15
MGFLPPDDDRIKATVLAIADELTEDGLVLRYRVAGTDTGFSGEEGTFTICSFWLVTALAMIGETERAPALCQKLLSFAGPLLLYAEEIDTTTGQHLGNFPQAFTHLSLIEAGPCSSSGSRGRASPPPRKRPEQDQAWPGTSSADRQNGCPAGSAKTRHWSLGWKSYLVAPAARTRASVASRSSTSKSRCICMEEAGSGQAGGVWPGAVWKSIRPPGLWTVAQESCNVTVPPVIWA